MVDRQDPGWTHEGSDNRFTPEQVMRLMDIIVPCIPRIQSLLLLANTWSTTLALPERLSEIHAPTTLERLEIVRSGPTYVKFSRDAFPTKLLSPTTLFGGCAPALRHVSLFGVHVNWSSSPLRNLRVLEFRKIGLGVMPTLKEFRSILESSLCLDTLTFDSCGPDSRTDGVDESAPIALMHLETLNLYELPVSHALCVLQLFNAPHLRRLGLVKLAGDGADGVIRKITGAFPLLSVLTVSGLQNVSKALLLPWFFSLPILRYLKVADVPQMIFEALLFYRDQEPLTDTKASAATVSPLRRLFVCPKLKVIECADLDPATITQFCLRRRAIGSPLEKVNLAEDLLQWPKRMEFQKIQEMRLLHSVPPGSRPDLDDRYIDEDPA